VSADHYFAAEPVAPAHTTEIEFTVAGRDFQLAAAGGVFSAGRLDPGTAVLLRKAPLPAAQTTGTLLDLGCGYGPIACTLASLASAARVYAVDINARAIGLANANAQRLGLTERLTACLPDDVPAEVRFAQIWSNPPIRVGKAALHELLGRWLPRLAPDGVAWLVVGKHLGADSLASWLAEQHWLAEQGWQVERIASQKGFRVLRVGHPGKHVE
jgi:16S rRNA G1207 methylase RsmC